jgi:hypothetical protein
MTAPKIGKSMSQNQPEIGMHYKKICAAVSHTHFTPTQCLGTGFPPPFKNLPVVQAPIVPMAAYGLFKPSMSDYIN